MGKPYASPPLNIEQSSLNLDNKINPSILYIIIILAIIFSVSALLHLFLRCYLRQTGNNLDHEQADVTALQGQLRQLFHLHDAGVDQLYIDTLPVFPYKAIIGVKDPFDCAVCLCEFEDEDKLRLLPKCSHAFHMDCIDTWLLSHSTCPLCRSSIIHDYNDFGGKGFPFVCVLESGSVEPSREIRESGSDDLDSRVEFGSGQVELERKSLEVKLGKLKNEDGLNNGRIMDRDVSRRCYSMGSFAYVMDEKTSLQVPINTLMKKQRDKKPRHRVAMSEYGFDSRRYFNGNGNGNGNGNEKRDSFSVSKIWQRAERNKKGNDCSSRRTISEIEIEIDEGELRGDEEIQSCYSVDSSTNHVGSTSHRRTLLWLMGKHNKVVHNHTSSISSNVKRLLYCRSETTCSHPSLLYIWLKQMYKCTIG